MSTNNKIIRIICLCVKLVHHWLSQKPIISGSKQLDHTFCFHLKMEILMKNKYKNNWCKRKKRKGNKVWEQCGIKFNSSFAIGWRIMVQWNGLVKWSDMISHVHWPWGYHICIFHHYVKSFVFHTNICKWLMISWVWDIASSDNRSLLR